jgi:nuclear protein localization family protein 4
MAVKHSSDDEYVPDIFFVEKDKYGNQIKQSAKPTFPTEYLMVDMPAGASVRVERIRAHPVPPPPCFTAHRPELDLTDLHSRSLPQPIGHKRRPHIRSAGR